MTHLELEERISELAGQWQALIGPEHHKDRDCHFYITRRWSYGQPPVWEVQHFGYWAEKKLDVVCPSYGAALTRLSIFIDEQIHDARKTIEECGHS